MSRTNDQLWVVKSPVDRSSPLPLHYQLKQRLLGLIRDEGINPGDLLPSEKDLEELYGVSQITVRRAMRELSVEGHIVRKAGRGSFVRQIKFQDHAAMLGGFANDLTSQGYKAESQILDLGRRPATAVVAKKLSIETGKNLLWFKRLLMADDEPIAISNAYLNVGQHIVFTREELNRDSVFPLLEQNYGLVLRRAQKSIEVTVTLEDEAEILGVAVNAPALLTELVVFDEKGDQICFVKTLYRGDRYKYHISLPQ